MGKKFIARESFTFDNGAIGWSPGGPFDCLGPFAKVNNCPISGTSIRLTCYATGYADTYFSIPACTRYRGEHVRGYLTSTDDGTNSVEFRVMDSHKHLFAELVQS
jgi:hypothetical protein